MHIVLIKSFTDKSWRSPATYQRIETCLNHHWDVTSIEPQTTDDIYTYLRQVESATQDTVFVFNIAEYIDETHKLGFIPELLDQWGIPHLGSQAAAIRTSLVKSRTKQHLIQQGIPTPKYHVIRTPQDISNIIDTKPDWPLFVKPMNEGGHIGISVNSIVRNATQLTNVATDILTRYHQPAIVENYITGKHMREFSVGIIAGQSPLFMPIEIDWEAMDVDEKILSHEVAQLDGERIKSIHDKTLVRQLKDLTLRTFNAVGAKDYSRVDLRMNSKACYVLEINTMPGLGASSFLPQAAQNDHELTYCDLITEITKRSLKRQGLI